MTIKTFPNIEQGTQEWMDVRRGILTASVVGQLITIGAPDALTALCPACLAPVGSPCVSRARKEPVPIKTIHDERSTLVAALPPVYGVARDDYAHSVTITLAAERITGWTESTAMTPDMWRGVESEPHARDAYSDNYAEVTEFGFMRRDEDNWSLGYSPDGLVGDDGLIEIKAPRAKTHLKTILADEVPAHYMAQLQSGLLVSGRKWIDFVSFVGGMPLYVHRVTPEPAWFDAITAACIAFEQNITQIVADYTERVADLPQTERIDFEIKVA